MICTVKKHCLNIALLILAGAVQAQILMPEAYTNTVLEPNYFQGCNSSYELECRTSQRVTIDLTAFRNDINGPPEICMWFRICLGDLWPVGAISNFQADHPVPGLRVFITEAPADCGSDDLQNFPCSLTGTYPGFNELIIQQPGSMTPLNVFGPGEYYLVYVMSRALREDPIFEVRGSCCSKACPDCLSSFAPISGRKYILNAWASLENIPVAATSLSGPQIVVGCTGTVGCNNGDLGVFTPEGPIIDGWQRIEGEFEVPADDPSELMIVLRSNDGTAYFDDVRVFPANGAMKSYVYDPSTLRLVAELDERHFATIYEYDDEGKLTRVKKETERGIMTLKETRYHSARP